jgi:alkanesulfonate monooxygenase SsuD/methylene tetrahydromethanopterin reductase-like flavin-dependent oxidoreductase (luciferase family)
VKIGFKTAQMNVDWPTLADTWRLGDELTVFDSGWLFDHFVSINRPLGGNHEAWTIASAVAALTSRLEFGHLVLGNTYRYPPLLAKMATTLDHVSQGRFILGIGAGHRPDEHHMFGYGLAPIGERMDRLESALRLLRGIWASPAGFTIDAPPFRLENAHLEPPPYTEGGPRIWIGTRGPKRGLQLVARYAHGWNFFGPLEDFVTLRDTLRRHCDAEGRPFESIETSTQVFLRDTGIPTLLELARSFALAGIDHLVLGMPAEMGPRGLQQLADEVATPLREEFLA